MKLAIVLSAILLNGCAYTAVSTVSLVTTGKSATDHITSQVTQNDCNGIDYVTGKQDYYCEQARDIAVRYNRNPF